MSDDWKNEKPDRSNEIGFDQQLEGSLRHAPFVPFTIIMNNGDRYEITRPLSVAVGNSLIWLAPKGTGFVYLRKNQIIGVEVQEPAA